MRTEHENIAHINTLKDFGTLLTIVSTDKNGVIGGLNSPTHG